MTDERDIRISLKEYAELIRENQILRCQHEMDQLQRTIDDLNKELEKVKTENACMYFQLHPLTEVNAE